MFFYSTTPAGRRKISSPATTQPRKNCCDSAHKKPLYLELPVSSNGPFVYNRLSELFLSSIKEYLFPLFSGFARDLQISRIAILCCLKETLLAGKIPGYLSKVDTCKIISFQVHLPKSTIFQTDTGAPSKPYYSRLAHENVQLQAAP